MWDFCHVAKRLRASHEQHRDVHFARFPPIPRERVSVEMS
jgi:hypothetical protein